MYGGLFCIEIFVGTFAEARPNINKHVSKTISDLPIFLIEEILDLFKLWWCLGVGILVLNLKKFVLSFFVLNGEF